MKENAREPEAALRERVKELSCLYGIARIVACHEMSLEDTLQGVVELLPPTWHYPEIAGARILLDDQEFKTAGFQDSPCKLSADIRTSGRHRGTVEVVYSGAFPISVEEGPFLDEEKKLLEVVAGETGLVIERREAEQERANLHHQLQHADRLTTIGLLAAGVAHELNEPLNSILGFAQLAKKSKRLPKQTRSDIERIEQASLHAREVIRNLLLFARQAATSQQRVNLNDIVRSQGLYFLESRCARDGVDIVHSLDPDLPDIVADPSQMTQVLVNVVVNALQAMPNGGTLTLQTLAGPRHVSLIVSDTGTGITQEVMDKLFIPFFTTKDVGQGTGLGLPVAHGIVTSHGGAMQVDNIAEGGARVEIQLPKHPSPQEESG